MKRYLSLIFLPLALTSHAAEISWTATGTVSSVMGSGFSGLAATGNPVSVKFSYQDNVLVNSLSFFMFGSFQNGATEFYGNVGLTMEVTIGSSTWKSVVASNSKDGTTYSLHTDAWDGEGQPEGSVDVFTVLASSTDSGLFSPFPYNGSNTARTMRVVLQDATPPAQFFQIATVPDDSAVVSNITAGNGSVAAGSDRINFTLVPNSVTVVKEQPSLPLKISRTLTGIELRWPSETGVTYQLEEGDSLTAAGWTIYNTYPGTGSEIVVSLSPFNDHPLRRFYRVVTE